MKRLRVNSGQTPVKSSIFKHQKCFTILLGNGIRLSYTTQKDFHYALAEVNRRLNVFLFELNEIYIFNFGEYRRLWFYLQTEITPDARYLVEHHNDIHRFFTLSIERTSGENGSVFSFKFLYNICESLVKQLAIMAEIRRRKRQFIEYHLLQTKIRAVKRISEELKGMTVEARYAVSVRVD